LLRELLNHIRTFKDPMFKQIKDRINELSVPPILRKTAHYSVSSPILELDLSPGYVSEK
jgi:hypothetical protein